MKHTHVIKNSAGIGLIEVLITTVVVAVGLLAVGSLQGDLIGGSRSNKTRAECQTLVNAKMEGLRDTIEKTGVTGYTQLAGSTANETITGVTETFTRWWLVTNETNPERKRVRVKACWADGCNATNPNSENTCVVQSVIAFDGVGNSSFYSNPQGSGAGAGVSITSPTPGGQGVDDISGTIELPTAATPGTITTVGGKTYLVGDTGTRGSRADLCSSITSPALTQFETELALAPPINLTTNLWTRRINFDGVAGDESVELFEKVVIGGQDYCKYLKRYNGGVLVPIRGHVYSRATTGNGQNVSLLGVNLFFFTGTESDPYCVFKPATNVTDAPYVCYVAGNCTGYTGTTSTTDVTTCPGSIAAAKVSPGGWRGKLGLLGVATNNRNVCFGEEVAGAPATVDTARNYYTRNAGLNEGINKPYNCHDFLIINGQNTMAQMHDVCEEKADTISGLNLASKTIQRNITGANIYDSVIDTTYCPGTASHTVTVAITGATPTSGSIAVTPSSGAATGSCTGSGAAYTCSVPNNIDGTLTFTGLVNLNGYSGTASYSAGTATQAVTLAISLTNQSTSCSWSGGTVTNNSTVTAYQASTVPYGSTCASEQRTCASGTLSGSYSYASCAVQAGASCTLNGVTVLSGASVTAYQSATPTGACVSEQRTCTNGTASGSFANSSCTAGCSATITGKANNKDDDIMANGTVCTVNNNRDIACPTISNLATGTAISVVSTGSVNSTKTVTVACPATAYTVNF